MDPRRIGWLVGILLGEGSFTGDGKQPAIAVKMHVRHEATLRGMLDLVPGSKLYGPYNHSGRDYFLWQVRGDRCGALVRLVLDNDDLLDDHLRDRIGKMVAAYPRQFSHVL
ncbi:MAG: hypothetical protein ABIW84_00120 [Ilumatobacteraceae bacterium]